MYLSPFNISSKIHNYYHYPLSNVKKKDVKKKYSKILKIITKLTNVSNSDKKSIKI